MRHPGKQVRAECLERHGLTVTRGARVLGVERQTLSNLVNGRSGISPEMAVRLEKAFGTPARDWLLRQLEHDLAAVTRRAAWIAVEPWAAPAGSGDGERGDGPRRPVAAGTSAVATAMEAAARLRDAYGVRLTPSARWPLPRAVFDGMWDDE